MDMDGGPLACLDILEGIANQLQDDADSRRLRLVCRAAQQAVDRVGVWKARLTLPQTQQGRDGKELSQRFPNIKHLVLAFPACGLRSQAEVESAMQLLHAISQLRRCTHLEVSMSMKHSTRLVPALGSPGMSSAGPGSSRRTGLPIHVWNTLTRCCPPSVTHLTLPYDTWRQPAPPTQQQSAADFTEQAPSTQQQSAADFSQQQQSAAGFSEPAPSARQQSAAAFTVPAPSAQQRSATDFRDAPTFPQQCQDHMTLASTSIPPDSNHGQPLLSDTRMAHDSPMGDAYYHGPGGSNGGGSHEGGGGDLQGIGAGSSSSSSSSSSEGGTAAAGPPMSVCLPEGVRAAAAQVAATTAAASAEPGLSADGGEDCCSSSSSSSSSNNNICGKNQSSSCAGGNEEDVGDGYSDSHASSNHSSDEADHADHALHAELEWAMSDAQAVGHSLPSLDQDQEGSSNPLSRFLDAHPHISSLALTGSTCCWSRKELASIAALKGITRLCGLSVTSLDITPLTNIASSLQHLEICLPDSPHPDEQDPSSYVARAPADTVSSLVLLTHLDLWGFSGNPTHLLLQLASLPHLAHLSLFGLSSPHADRIDDLALRALGLLPALTSFGADQIRITEASADAEDALCLSQLTRLEVGQRVVSFLRLPHVFPNVQDVKLQWLWEQSMRKLAGWLSITSLSLSHLSYCVDWRLLRTLKNLRHLSLDGCSSMSLLAQLLHLCADLPCLSCLTLSYWGIEMVEQRQQQQQQQRQQQVVAWSMQLQQQLQQQQQQQQQGQGHGEQLGSSGLLRQQQDELRGPIDAAVAQMSSLTQLERLEMSHCPAALLVDGHNAPPNLKELHLSGIPLSSQDLFSLVLGESQDVARAREEGLQSSEPVLCTGHDGDVGLDEGEVQQNTSAPTTFTPGHQPLEEGGQSASFSGRITEAAVAIDASSRSLRPGSRAELHGNSTAASMGAPSAAAEREAASGVQAEGAAAEQEAADSKTAIGTMSCVNDKLGALALSTPAASQANFENTGHGAGGTHHNQNSLSTALPRDGSNPCGPATAAATAAAAAAAGGGAPLEPSPPSPSHGASLTAPLHSLLRDPLGSQATAAPLRVGLCQLSGLTRLELGPMLPAPVGCSAPMHHPSGPAGPASSDTAIGAGTIL
ncbi:hypothetical protein DUNSADRAFT_15280 [Dunaliella salina]|uniref:F-box domain-containing protein n=1 Tax=Dunaliella salina TaxID=3046 RepID=A0ABQ7G5V1_DUNSA|nr:hypothetical protein DUNSADRAFT_15280 [Dunaliella salina]|eukprot:KAF5829944.1 hypothetical protein DUNSADRAFT_15280 [Dunaliella salina]